MIVSTKPLRANSRIFFLPCSFTMSSGPIYSIRTSTSYPFFSQYRSARSLYSAKHDRPSGPEKLRYTAAVNFLTSTFLQILFSVSYILFSPYFSFIHNLYLWVRCCIYSLYASCEIKMGCQPCKPSAHSIQNPLFCFHPRDIQKKYFPHISGMNGTQKARKIQSKSNGGIKKIII